MPSGRARPSASLIEGLNKAVQKLRQALDDSPDDPRFIETVVLGNSNLSEIIRFAEVPDWLTRC